MDNSKEKSKWEFNFKEERLTEEDQQYYLSFGIRGRYTGIIMSEPAYWITDREKKMYVVGNQCVGPRLKEDGVEGPDYDNFIYKDKVGDIGIEYSFTRKEYICRVKSIIFDKSLQNEEEYLLSAIKSAYIGEAKSRNRKCIIEEFPKEIRFV